VPGQEKPILTARRSGGEKMVQQKIVPEIIPELVDKKDGTPCNKMSFYFYVQISKVHAFLNFRFHTLSSCYIKAS
jgi:hypothetical protein